MIFGISGTKRTVRYREVSVLQRCRKERLDCILIFSFQFTGSNGVLDTFLVFLVLFNYVIPISLYVTVGRYPERHGTVSLCKKRLLLNIAPHHRDVLRHQQQGLMRGACNLMKFNNTKKFCYQNASGKDLKKKTRHFQGAPLSSVVLYITEKMHVQLNVCFKHLRNIQFSSKPAFHSLFHAPRWYGKRIEKSGAKKPHGSWGETGIENGAAKN